jgi:membrane fusion protein (multidrug efflux system)
VDVLSAAETAQLEPTADRVGSLDFVAPEDRRQQPRQNSDAATQRSADRSPNKGWLHRHPVVFVLASASLLLLTAAGYLDWDNSLHFETTDDAYIASRQFAIAPEVPGLHHGGTGY